MGNKSPREIAHAAYSACVMEASAEKPGNVTPTKCFYDLSHRDFLKAAKSLEPFVEKAARDGENADIGKIIFDATSAEKNINFGIVMMLIPLAATRGGPTKKLLESLTTEDAEWIVRAMQKGKLGGMELKDKSLSKYDVFSNGIFEVIKKEGITPMKLMNMSGPYDTLAKEWVFDYPLSRAIARRVDADPGSIVEEHLRLLSQIPDTLIARKAGIDKAKEVSQMARWVLSGNLGIGDFDSFLRSDGNKLNPGTTADLIAAGLFLKLLS